MAFITDLLVNPFFVAVISGTIGILGTYLAAIQKYRKDLEAQFDKSLREERVKVYPKLWRILTTFQSEIGTFASGTNAELDNVRKSFHEWYSENGIYLSESSVDFYWDFFHHLQRLIIKGVDWDFESPEDRYHLMEKASKLRRSLADDLGSRRSIFNRPRRRFSIER